jgi:hypothetical protein
MILTIHRKLSLWVAWAKCPLPRIKWTTARCSCSTFAVCNHSRYRCHKYTIHLVCETTLELHCHLLFQTQNPFLTYKLHCICDPLIYLTHLLGTGAFSPRAKWPVMKLIPHLHQILQLRVTGSIYLLFHVPSWCEETTIRIRYTAGTMLWVGGSSVQILVVNCGACVCTHVHACSLM